MTTPTPTTDTQQTLSQVMRQHSLRLAAFALGTALLVALAYNLTKDRIAFQRLEAERQALNAVLPAALHDNDLLAASFELSSTTTTYTQPELLGLSTSRTGYRATQNGQVTGVILPLETADGYSGTIILLVGINADGNLTGARVLQHAETPGLGDKIDIRLSPWITSFDNRSLANTPEPLWQVKKDGGDFDQFVGATITPRAVVGAVHKALLFFAANQSVLLQTKQTEQTP
jgi:Na+-translocating ferredoxin:NAD+ oxidoreductase subunit G